MIRQEDGIICIETANTGYYFTRRGDIAEHLHYGRKLRPGRAALQEKVTQPYGSSVIYDAEKDSSLSLMDLMLELSPRDRGDFRPGPVEIRMPDGSGICDFRWDKAEVLPEKPQITELPQADSPGPCLRLQMRTPEGVSAICLYTPYEEADVITRQIGIRNDASEPVTVRRLFSYQLDLEYDDYTVCSFSGAWAREMEPDARPVRGCTIRLGNASGTSSHFQNPFFYLTRPGTGETAGEAMGFHLLYSGSHAAEICGDAYGRTRVMAGIGDSDFSWTLMPGETLWAPEAAFTWSGDGTGRMSRSLHRFIRESVIPAPWRGRKRPVLFNNWEGTYFNFNERRLLGMARRAADLGAELFVLDDGWFGRRTDDTRGLGDYDVNLQKLPSGLAGFSKKLWNMGLAFGLWVEPEMVNRDSALYEAHPEWTVGFGRPGVSLSRSQLVLDLCRTEVQDYIIDQLDLLLKDGNIQYIKWDMNRHHSDRLSGALTEQGQFPLRYMHGFYRVLSTITSRYPDVLFEGCASGGNRFDPGMLRYFPQIWLSDNTDAECRMKMQYQASFGYPLGCMGAHVSASPNHQTLRQSALESRFEVAAFGLLGYELDPGFLNAHELKAIREQIVFYRKNRDLLQQGAVYRLCPPDGDSGRIMVVSEDRNQAAVLEMVLRNRANSHDTPLRMAGLDPDRMYRIEVRTQKYDPRIFGSLLNTVLPVTLNDRGLLMQAASSVVEMDGERDSFSAWGDLLMYAGLRRYQRFCGTGRDEHVRVMPDGGTRIYLLRAVTEQEERLIAALSGIPGSSVPAGEESGTQTDMEGSN